MLNRLGKGLMLIALTTTIMGCQMASGVLEVPSIISSTVLQSVNNLPNQEQISSSASSTPSQKNLVKTTNLGIQLARELRHKEAIAALRIVTDERPSFCPAQVQLGQSYRATHQIDEAEQAYLRCLKTSPSDAAALLSLGVLYEIYRGEFDLALENYERYQQVNSIPDVKVDLWIADLTRRISSSQTTNQIAEVRP